MDREILPENKSWKSEYTVAPVEVKNKDIPLLSEILCIMQDIRQIEQLREFQQGRMYNITKHLSGLPRAGGVPKGLDDVFAMISELEEDHEKRFRDYALQLKKAEKILDGIESQSMRTFVMMKYVMNVPDAKIRNELNMTRRGFDRARRCVETATCMSAVKWQERYIIAQQKE